jgi:hypothetical protein
MKQRTPPLVGRAIPFERMLAVRIEQDIASPASLAPGGAELQGTAGMGVRDCARKDFIGNENGSRFEGSMTAIAGQREAGAHR